MLQKRTVISAPQDWATSLDSGKLAGQAHVVVTEVIYDDATGGIVGRPLNHRVVIEIKADGSWGLQVDPWGKGAPACPVSKPSDEQMGAALSIFAETASRYGIVDHILPSGKPVTFVKGDDGRFVRQVA